MHLGKVWLVHNTLSLVHIFRILLSNGKNHKG